MQQLILQFGSTSKRRPGNCLFRLEVSGNTSPPTRSKRLAILVAFEFFGRQSSIQLKEEQRDKGIASMNAVLQRMNNFARLDVLEQGLASTNDLVISINEGLDRVEGSLYQLGVVVGSGVNVDVELEKQIEVLRAELQTLSNLIAASALTDERLAAIERRLGVDRDDELADRWDGVLTKELGADVVAEKRAGVVDLPQSPVAEKDEQSQRQEEDRLEYERKLARDVRYATHHERRTTKKAAREAAEQTHHDHHVPAPTTRPYRRCSDLIVAHINGGRSIWWEDAIKAIGTGRRLNGAECARIRVVLGELGFSSVSGAFWVKDEMRRVAA
jgi:hypothetical protein